MTCEGGDTPMINVIKARIQQKKRTVAFPASEPQLPDHLRALPAIDTARCPTGCDACVKACPVGAISATPSLAVDMGKCLFCTDCTQVCPTRALSFTGDYRLAVSRRSDLICDGTALHLAQALDAKSRALFGRSLKLRQVSAGGCGACEADTNVLNTVVFDLGRFGIQFVASPRHADGVLVTGPVSRNMETALRKTWAAIPAPKLCIVVGACAISGGPFAGHNEVVGSVESIIPVDLFVPGCPPHPVTILDGLLRLLGRR